MRVYFDSSAFAKRCIEERGSEEVEVVCSQATELGLSVLCVPEILSALNRRRREGSLTHRHYDMAKRRLLEDVHDADVINLTPPIIGSAVSVLEAGALRALDALQIACALEWEAQLFVTSDERQIHAAKRAGLKTRQM